MASETIAANICVSNAARTRSRSSLTSDPPSTVDCEANLLAADASNDPRGAARLTLMVQVQKLRPVVGRCSKVSALAVFQ